MAKKDTTTKSFILRSDAATMEAVEKCGIETFISPTTSDWMKIGIPAIKMGPGDSARSHKADEYIKIEELHTGISTYIDFISSL